MSTSKHKPAPMPPAGPPAGWGAAAAAPMVDEPEEPPAGWGAAAAAPMVDRKPGGDR
jgi:hypothetical protein